MPAIPTQRCPYCSGELVGAEDVRAGRGPAPGDLGACVYCAGLLKFGPQMQLEKASPSDVTPEHSPELRRVQQAIRMTSGRRN